MGDSNMSERDLESTPNANFDDAVWTSILDKRYVIVVQRLSPYKGELSTQDGDRLVHREKVGLMYDAIFGPDVDDVARWQEIALRVIDAKPRF